MKRFLLAAALCGSVCSAGAVTATATGSYVNDPTIVVDAVFPIEYTGWTESSNLFWSWQEGASGMVVTLDLGATMSVSQLLVSVDNNDNYQFDASIDGTSWTPLWSIDWTQGNVGWGMDTISSDPGSAEFSGAGFLPLDARYVRVYATGGDASYAIGEVQLTAAATTVPEPASMALLLAGLGLIGAQVRRRR